MKKKLTKQQIDYINEKPTTIHSRWIPIDKVNKLFSNEDVETLKKLSIFIGEKPVDL